MSKIVCLTAGHSNTDPGACNGSDREADLAQDMRNIVASILRDDYGLTVKTDGTGKGRLKNADRRTITPFASSNGHNNDFNIKTMG